MQLPSLASQAPASAEGCPVVLTEYNRFLSGPAAQGLKGREQSWKATLTQGQKKGQQKHLDEVS